MIYIISMLPALCWGSIFIFLGLINNTSNKNGFATSFGAFLASLLFLPYITKESILVGVLSGIFWSIGFYYQLKCFEKAGASIAVPMSNGMQLILASLVSLVFFKEFNTLSLKIQLFFLVIILILGIFLVSYKEKKENKILDKEYYINIIISTIAFIIYITSTKVFNIEPESILLPQTLGMVIGFIYINRKNLKSLIDKKVLYAMFVGIVWFVGNLSMFFTIKNLGLAVSFSLAQLNVAVSTVLALLVLKEEKTKKELIFCLLGIIFIILSGIGIGYIGG